jgi:hypothetical protein
MGNEEIKKILESNKLSDEERKQIKVLLIYCKLLSCCVVPKDFKDLAEGCKLTLPKECKYFDELIEYSLKYPDKVLPHPTGGKQ